MYGYFEIQSRIGITKHMGGLTATRRLLERCHIDDTKCVLVVGSGSGVSAIKIAQLTQSRVVGIDLSDAMIKCAKEQLASDIEFIVGDAEDIQFPDNTFDAVLSESVTAFTDREKSLPEYSRVLKRGGYLGLNEVTWLVSPTAEIIKYALTVTEGLNPTDQDGWVASMQRAGFTELSVEAGPLKKFEQFIGELRMNGPQIPKVFSSFFSAYLSDREYRQSIHHLARASLKMPRGFLQAFGCGLYVGKKE